MHQKVLFYRGLFYCVYYRTLCVTLYLSLEKTLVIDLKESIYIIIPVHNHPRERRETERLSILFFKCNVVTY